MPRPAAWALVNRSGWSNLYRWTPQPGGGRTEAMITLADAEIGGPLWNLGQQSYVLLGAGRALLRLSRGTVDTLCLLNLASGQTSSLPLPLPSPLPLPFVGFGSVGLLDQQTAFSVAAARATSGQPESIGSAAAAALATKHRASIGTRANGLIMA